MNNSICTILILLVLIFANCSDATSGDEDSADSSPANDTSLLRMNSLRENNVAPLDEPDLTVLRAIGDWKTSDFIINEKDKSSASVRSTIENEIELWKNVEHPFTATYKGCDMGDYFHLIFEDSNGKNYDFGFGNNQFGEYDLCSKDITDNPKYLGKSFVIYWNWEISSFPCCDGEYDLVEAYMPSITKLELKE